MIIGLSGYARSGKDTVASLLEGYERRAFADPMRTALYTLNPFISTNIRLQDVVDDLGWEFVKSGFPEARRLLQTLGTEIGRKMIDEDVWVDMAVRDIERDSNVVFTDVRFKNEAWAITGLGGQIWRINRPGVEAVNAHTSETAMDEWAFDAVIDNSGTLEDLKAQVETALYFHALT